MTGSDYIAIIPAKRESQRVPEKNTALLNGVPLFWYSVAYARREGVTPVVSTDSRYIRDYCDARGVMTFDETVDESSMIHCIRQVMEAHPEYSRYVLLQLTSPIRKPGALQDIIAMDARCVFTASQIKLTGKLDMGDGSTRVMASGRDQDSRAWLYHFDGSMLTGDIDMVRCGQLFTDDAVPVVQESPYTLQIDTPWELQLVRLICFRTQYAGLMTVDDVQ